jgi:Kef-type K+ transport system membrane component KefB
MTPFLQLTLLLLVILLTAKAAGYLSIRIGQPSVLGELLAGVLLGPTLVDILHFELFAGHSEALSTTLSELGEIGVLFLMFLAGLELHLDELTKNTKVSALAGILGVLLPGALGYGTGKLFGMSNEASVFLGLTLGATSVSISAQVLMELKALRSRVGLGLLGAAVFDDVLVILMLSIFFAIVGGNGELVSILPIFGKMLVFFASTMAFGLWLLPLIIRRVRNLPISQSLLTLAIIIMFGYGLAAELVGGMAAITGTFLAGLLFARSPEKVTLEPRVHAIAYGFFVPIFFVNIGLEVDIKTAASAAGLALTIIVAAVLGKLLGAGLGARLAGFSVRESLQLGMGMVSRGEVGLIIAAVGIHQGLVSQEEFSAIIGMVIVTTLVTPPMLRYMFHEQRTPPQRESPAAELYTTTNENVPAPGSEKAVPEQKPGNAPQAPLSKEDTQ